MSTTLPLTTASPTASPSASSSSAEVTSDLHVYLLELWAQVFAEFHPGGAPASLGLDDDLFALGGTSLLAMMILSRIYDELQLEIHFRVLLDRPTIRGLAEHIASALAAGEGEL